MSLWQMLTDPFLHGTPDDPGGVRARAALSALEALLDRCGVERTAPVAVRAVEVLSTLLIVCRIEEALVDAGVLRVEADDAGARTSLHELLEPLAKWHERRRKALRELEDVCARSGTPLDAGLADTLKPLLRQADGVLEDALRFETARRPFP